MEYQMNDQEKKDRVIELNVLINKTATRFIVKESHLYPKGLFSLTLDGHESILKALDIMKGMGVNDNIYPIVTFKSRGKTISTRLIGISQTDDTLKFVPIK